MNHVYFLQVDVERGPVKIGRARRVPGRVRELQTGSPWPLRIIGAFDAGDRASELEALVHRSLSHLNIAGEWFRWSPVIGDAIVELEKFSLRISPHEHEWDFRFYIKDSFVWLMDLCSGAECEFQRFAEDRTAPSPEEHW